MPELWKQFGLQLIAPSKNVKYQLEPGLRFWNCGGFVSICLNNIGPKNLRYRCGFLGYRYRENYQNPRFKRINFAMSLTYGFCKSKTQRKL